MKTVEVDRGIDRAHRIFVGVTRPAFASSRPARIPSIILASSSMKRLIASVAENDLERLGFFASSSSFSLAALEMRTVSKASVGGARSHRGRGSGLFL